MHGAFTIPFDMLGISHSIRVAITKFVSTSSMSMQDWSIVYPGKTHRRQISRKRNSPCDHSKKRRQNRPYVTIHVNGTCHPCDLSGFHKPSLRLSRQGILRVNLKPQAAIPIVSWLSGCYGSSRSCHITIRTSHAQPSQKQGTRSGSQVQSRLLGNTFESSDRDHPSTNRTLDRQRQNPQQFQ